MNDDLLARATRALREETRDDDTGARFTRSRIMASVHERRVRRRTRLAFLLPIAATFLAASAWGAANGKLGQAVSALSEAIGLAPAEPSPVAPAPAPARPRVAERIQAPAPKPELVEAPPLPAPEPTAPEATPPTPARKAVPSGSVARPEGTAGSASDPAHELYRAAHRAHFVDRDSDRALRAWDAFLREAPNAALSLEARYNRALCLVRLQRHAEARNALRPFAEGRFGGYREAEAKKLLGALPADLAGPSDSGL
jgi:hypothetical protein